MIEAEADVGDLLEGLAELPAQLDRSMADGMELALHEIASIARQTSAFHDRSAATRNSIQPDSGPLGAFSRGQLVGSISAGTPYALYLEEGARPHPIRARFRRALRIPIQGGFRFVTVVMHPGIHATHFMANALEQGLPVAQEILADHAELAIVRAGFG